MNIVCWSCALVGAIIGPVLVWGAVQQGEQVTYKMLFLSPFIFGAMAYVVGLAFAFLFAPTNYLESESGQKWLSKVGTKTILSARIVCAILAALALGLFIAIAIAFANEQKQNRRRGRRASVAIARMELASAPSPPLTASEE